MFVLVRLKMSKTFVLVVLQCVALTAARSSFLTPVGPVSCATEVPHGSRVTHHGARGGFTVRDGATDEIIKIIEPCKRSAKQANGPNDGFRGGWQVYAKQNVSSLDFSTFTGQWTVPDAPKKYTGQTVFLFTGLQNEDWVPPDDGPKGKFDIIQPVLQYGPSAAGGGEYWMISSWYVPLGGFWDESVFSTTEAVKEGDVIFGNMTSMGGSKWFIDTFVVGNTSSHTSITVDKPRLAEQPWAYVTLESYADYDKLSCDMWPTKQSTFSDLQMSGSKLAGNSKDGFNWTFIQKDPACGAAATLSGENVVISF